VRVLAWTLRIILFLALFLLALKNTDTVSLHLYFDQVWPAPLILVLLVFFCRGRRDGRARHAGHGVQATARDRASAARTAAAASAKIAPVLRPPAVAST